MFSDTEVWGYICDPAANLGEITSEWPMVWPSSPDNPGRACGCEDTKEAQTREDRFSVPVSFFAIFQKSVVHWVHHTEVYLHSFLRGKDNMLVVSR